MSFGPVRFDGQQFLSTDNIDEYAELLQSKFPAGSAVFPAGVWILLTASNRKKITAEDDRLDWYSKRKWFQTMGQADVIYVPILYSAHWILATIRYQARTITMYNSLPTYAYDEENIHDNLSRLAGFLKPTTQGAEYKFIVDKDGCRQKDGYNCGVYVLKRIRANVLGDMHASMDIDELRLHFKNEIWKKDIKLFRDVIIIDEEEEMETTDKMEEEQTFDNLRKYYMNGFVTVKQLGYPTRGQLGILRVNQPIENSPTFIIKFVIDGRMDRIETVFKDSVAAGIKIHGLMLNPSTDLDQNLIGLLEEDKQ